MRDPRFYKRALAGGAIGTGESFVDGWWDSPALDQAITRMLDADLRARLKLSPFMLADAIAEHLPNLPYDGPASGRSCRASRAIRRPPRHITRSATISTACCSAST